MRILIYFFFVFSFFSFLNADEKIHNGLIEISELDRVYVLTGEWKFFSGKNPEAYKWEFDDSSWGEFPVPSVWLFKKVPKLRNGWYRLHFKISPEFKGETLGFITPNIQEAHRAYFNGVFIGSSGEMDQYGNLIKENSKSNLYKIPSELIIFNKPNILSIEVANYHGGFGGIYNIPYFGTWDLIKKKYYLNLMWIAGICFLLFIFGIYHFILFLGQRKELSFLYYSFLSFCLGSFIFVNYKINLWIVESFLLQYILFTLSVGLIGIILYLLAKSLFGESLSKFEKKVILVYSVFIFVHLLCIFNKDWLAFRNLYLIRITIFFTAIFTIRGFIIILESVFAQKPSAKIVLVGYFLASPFLMIDIARTLNLGKMYPWFISEGSIILMITYSYAIAVKNSTTYEKLIKIQKQYKEELQNLVDLKSEQLIAANKSLSEANELKNKIFTIISHDLRSPLNTLNQIIYLFKNNRYTKEKFKKYIVDISMNLKRNKFLLGNLMNWSQSQLADTKDLPEGIVEIDKIIEELISFFLPDAFKKSIQLEFVKYSNRFVIGNQNALRIIIGNLISNAIKFTNPFGKIQISVSTKSEYCIVEVSDNGVGISEERISLILSRSDLDSSYGTNKEVGTGIGLKICLDLVRKLNGKVEIKSKLGKGSKFRIYFLMFKEKV